MRATCEQKEDLRLRMAGLEKKLAESEEERLRLEKTCNVLMRAFREEEKMHYKALNKKYEKFLEDCSMRRRRNEIILRSLCRIEDRSRALYAKTERLKLLKDRYISYLKINQFKQDEDSPDNWKNFPFASRDASGGVTTKSVQWKTPLALGVTRKDFCQDVKGDVLSATAGPFLVEKLDAEKAVGFEEFGRRGKWNRMETDFMYPIAVETKREELLREKSRIMEEDESKADRIEKGREEAGHPGSIGRLAKSLSAVDWPESECPDPNIRILADRSIKPNELDSVEARKKPLDEFPIRDDHVVTSAVGSRAYGEGHDRRSSDTELEEGENSGKEVLSEGEKTLPQGLDGVDYQNETYPESYYEQPVHHHNNLSIASDVILEEDETEEDVEEEEKEVSRGLTFEEPRGDSGDGVNGHVVRMWEQAKSPKGHSAVVEPHSVCAPSIVSEACAKDYLGNGAVGVFDQAKNRESDSEKSSGGRRSESHSGDERGKGRQRAEGNASEEKLATKSNLIHMLESDSESFQIEHGDGVSGNEDSDFDFSFGKN